MWIGGEAVTDLGAAIEKLAALKDPFTLREAAGPDPSASFNRQNDPPVPAHRIEQGGIGFSAIDPIGTEHVANCVALVVRDPQSGLTALTHFDDRSDPRSLDQIFDRLPKDRVMEAMLVGAKYGAQEEDSYVRNSSRQNLQSVLEMMERRNVNVVAARIHDRQQPHAFSVDPKTFTLRADPALLPNADAPFAFARKFLSVEQKQPLAVEFDLTKSPDRFRYSLGAEQIENLEARVRGRSLEDITDWHRSKGARGGFEHTMAQLSLDYLAAFDRGDLRKEETLKDPGVSGQSHGPLPRVSYSR